MSNAIKFSVDGRLISELGERLVTRNHVAMAELIKNAYDADATKITVKFLNAKDVSKTNSIIISDNGEGMTFEQIKANWMRIATPNKVRAPISTKYGRSKTGDKGVGRFSCSRLAKRLILTSTAKIGPNTEKTTVTFDWSDFEQDSTLTEIPNHYKREFVDDDAEIGTTLSLIELRDVWYQRDFDVLRRNILSLSIISPTKRKRGSKVFDEDPGFAIIFDAPEFEMGTGELSTQVMDAGWGRLKGLIRDDGVAEFKLDALEIGEKKHELPELFPELSGISFDIAIVWPKPSGLDPKPQTLLYCRRYALWAGHRFVSPCVRHG